MNTTGTTPTPSRPPYPGARGHGAKTLAPEVWSWLPPMTRISTLWVEETPEGERLVYCHIRDNVRFYIGIVALWVSIAGIYTITAMSKSGFIPFWLWLTSLLLITAATAWASIWFPETGPGGTYPIDAEGRLLPKINNPRRKGLLHRKP